MILGWSIIVLTLLIGGPLAVFATMKLQQLPLARRMEIGRWAMWGVFAFNSVYFGAMALSAYWHGHTLNAAADAVAVVGFGGGLMVWIAQIRERPRDGAK